MNKKLILSFLLPIFVAACSSPKLDEPEVVIDIPATKSFVGVVNKLSVPLNNLESDFYLLTDSKNRIYLNSLIHNLQDYIDYEVRLRGQIQYSDLAGKQVEILNVEQIDIISTPEVELDILNYESSNLGISFEYLATFDLEEFSSQLSLSDPNSRQLIKFKFIDKTSDQNLSFDSYVDSLNLDAPKETYVTNNHRYDLYNLSSDTIKYFLESNKYILEITYIFLDASNEGFTAFDEFLNSLKLSDVEISESSEQITETNPEISIDSDDPSTNDSLEDENDDSDSDQTKTPLDDVASSLDVKVVDYTQNEMIVTDEDFTNEVDSEYLNIINNFESNIDSVLDSFQSSISYSFTDNDEFYLIYFDTNDNQKRVLIDYSNGFKTIATFKEGSVSDWDLVSGVNIAFDRPLTVINKQDNQFLPSVSLKEGFRLFESLAMKIQSFYPTDWYYSRQDDVYIFSSDPKTFEPSMLISLMDDSSSKEYLNLSLNEYIQVSTNIFVKKLNAGFFKLEFIDDSTDTSYILDSLRDV
ncbi:hypothetical protein CL656_01100 [bacterium]|nr:hypothetical protein [bacterium]